MTLKETLVDEMGNEPIDEVSTFAFFKDMFEQGFIGLADWMEVRQVIQSLAVKRTLN